MGGHPPEGLLNSQLKMVLFWGANTQHEEGYVWLLENDCKILWHPCYWELGFYAPPLKRALASGVVEVTQCGFSAEGIKGHTDPALCRMCSHLWYPVIWRQPGHTRVEGTWGHASPSPGVRFQLCSLPQWRSQISWSREKPAPLCLSEVLTHRGRAHGQMVVVLNH